MNQEKKMQLMERIMARKLADLERDYDDTLKATRQLHCNPSIHNAPTPAIAPVTVLDSGSDSPESNGYQSLASLDCIDQKDDSNLNQNQFDSDNFQYSPFQSASQPASAASSSDMDISETEDFAVDWTELSGEPLKENNHPTGDPKKLTMTTTLCSSESDSARCVPSKPCPLSAEKVLTIKQVMSTIQLKAPIWASSISEEVWLNKFIISPQSPTFTNTKTPRL